MSRSGKRKSWLERLDDTNQRWAGAFHPEVTLHTAAYGLLSIRLMLPERYEAQPGRQWRTFVGRTKWDRTSAPGETIRAHIMAPFFAFRSAQRVPGNSHRIFVVVAFSLGGDQIGLLIRERWFNLLEGQARIEQLRAHFASGGEITDLPPR